MKKRTVIVFFLFAIALIALSRCGEISKTKTLKLAHGLDVSHPVHKGMAFMAERVAEN